jgi:flagellar rod assembly protein/muramidase FlgJ
MDPASFIDQISKAAQDAQEKTGVPASFTIAEAALESGWGASRLAVEANNFFGVKADESWAGDTVTMDTREFLNGTWVMVPARWRKYADFDACLVDHGAFLKSNPRYASCFSAPNSEGFAWAIQQAGYATDPGYANKLISIMRAHNLSQYDLIGDFPTLTDKA